MQSTRANFHPLLSIVRRVINRWIKIRRKSKSAKREDRRTLDKINTKAFNPWKKLVQIDLSSDTANIHDRRNLETVADLSSFDGSADASNGGRIDIRQDTMPTISCAKDNYIPLCHIIVPVDHCYLAAGDTMVSSWYLPTYCPVIYIVILWVFDGA